MSDVVQEPATEPTEAKAEEAAEEALAEETVAEEGVERAEGSESSEEAGE